MSLANAHLTMPGATQTDSGKFPTFPEIFPHGKLFFINFHFSGTLIPMMVEPFSNPCENSQGDQARGFLGINAYSQISMVQSKLKRKKKSELR